MSTLAPVTPIPVGKPAPLTPDELAEVIAAAAHEEGIVGLRVQAARLHGRDPGEDEAIQAHLGRGVVKLVALAWLRDGYEPDGFVIETRQRWQDR